MADVAVHSDFLIHWTGKDFDDPEKWRTQNSSTIEGDTPLGRAYVERLRSILEHGLWLTVEPETMLKTEHIDTAIPSTPKVCFTELKLSESRTHAKRYGRLGIGVKRPYLVIRNGRPVSYVCYHFQDEKDPFFHACTKDLSDSRLLNFFKPMNSSRELNYDLYGESEWRILFFEHLLEEGLLLDPRDPANTKEYAYFQSLSPNDQERLHYLARLDGWLSIIIYPSTSVKNAAMADSGVRSALKIIKDNLEDHGNRVEGGNWPIELNLDACRNF